MIWKDYLYFTRFERNGIKLLLALLIMAAFAPPITRLIWPQKEMDFEWLAAQTDEFEEKRAAAVSSQSTVSRQSNNHLNHGGSDHNVRSRQNARADIDASLPDRSKSRVQPAGSSADGAFDSAARSVEPVHLYPRLFNPNGLSSEDWEAMGIPAHVARTIKNFEAAGGSFRFKEDLQRIYLMEDAWYTELEPFIQLPSFDEAMEKRSEAVETALVDINRADTADLLTLRGIGKVFSHRIIEYRERLGGFVAADQLLEVYGMDSTRFEQLLPQIIINTSHIRKIRLYEADYISLVRHPYINPGLANALLSFMNQHSPLDSLGQLRQSFLISDEVYDRISPYLQL